MSEEHREPEEVGPTSPGTPGTPEAEAPKPRDLNTPVIPPGLVAFFKKWIPIAWRRGKAALVATPGFVRGPLRDIVRTRVVAPAKRGYALFGPRALRERFTPAWHRARDGVRDNRIVRLAYRSVRRGLRIGLTGGLLALLVGGAFALCAHRVPPGTIAVRHARFFSTGVDRVDYTMGLHFGLRGLHGWHYLPGRTMYLTYANQPLPGELGLLKVRTKDGNVARVGVSVPYRIVDGEAHQLVAEGLKEAYADRVRATVEKILLQELANLSSTDFATTDVRRARAEATLEVLNRELAEIHVRAEGVFLQSVYFPSDYEQKLQQTQLLAQQMIMNRALVEYENAKQDIGIERARIDSAERELRGDIDLLMEQDKADAELEIARIRQGFLRYRGQREGQAMADYDRIVSEGESAVDRANAYRTKKFAEVYQTPGGRMYLASMAAGNLNIDDVTLNSNDPDVPTILDLDELLELLVGTPDE